MLPYCKFNIIHRHEHELIEGLLFYYLIFPFFDGLCDEALDFFQTLPHFLFTLWELSLQSLNLCEKVSLEIIGFSFVTNSSVFLDLLSSLKDEVKVKSLTKIMDNISFLKLQKKQIWRIKTLELS